MHTAYQIIRLAAERTPSHLALVDDRTDRQLNYSELLAEIDAVAAGLSMRGIGAGTRVATVLPGLWEHCILLLALMRLNAVPALLNHRLKADQIAGLCRNGGIEAAVIQPDKELASAITDALPGNAPIWTAGGSGAGQFADCRGLAERLSPFRTPDAEDTAFLFYTSGTTGLPKAVILPHRATEARVLWLATQAGLRQGTHNRALGCMPLSHAIGFFGLFLVTLAFNGTYFVVSAFNPEALVKLIERERITYAFCVPTMYQAMVSAPGYLPSNMASMELVLYGGQTIDPDLLVHIDREWGGVVRHIYGTTETMCSLYHPEPLGRHATLRPGYYSRVRLARLDGGGPEDLAGAGEEGELIVDATTDTIFSGYLGNPEATQEKIRDGWYYTGDVFLQEDSGDVTLIGRTDDMIRSSGESIHPQEVEAVLEAREDILEAAVVGIPDRQWGSMAVACVTAAEGVTVNAGLVTRIDEGCRNSDLAGFKRPKAYVFFERLPRNAADKILRAELRRIAEAARKEQENWYSARPEQSGGTRPL